MRTLLVLLPLLLATIAQAQPVRDDIVDIRHKRSPNRRVPLGWTANNHFVVHVASCGVNDAGGPFCSSTLEIVGERATESIVILGPKCDPCDPYKDDFRYTIPTDQAMQAIRKERTALQRLGPLRATAPASPEIKLVQNSCQIVLKHGTRRAKFKVDDCLHEGGSNSISDAAIASIDTSPDGGTLAVTVGMQLRFMEWTDAHTVVLLLQK